MFGLAGNRELIMIKIDTAKSLTKSQHTAVLMHRPLAAQTPGARKDFAYKDF